MLLLARETTSLSSLLLPSRTAALLISQSCDPVPSTAVSSSQSGHRWMEVGSCPTCSLAMSGAEVLLQMCSSLCPLVGCCANSWPGVLQPHCDHEGKPRSSMPSWNQWIEHIGVNFHETFFLTYIHFERQRNQRQTLLHTLMSWLANSSADDCRY